jgi:hypothetical protein
MRGRKKDTEKFEKNKNAIVELAKTYLEKDGKINMSAFRKENPSIYTRLHYYFNGIDGLIKEVSPQTLEDSSRKSNGRGCPVNGNSVRNELAYDMLLLLRKNMTLHEIGQIYGVSRAHIHQLLHAIEKTSSKERKVKLNMLV